MPKILKKKTKSSNVLKFSFTETLISSDLYSFLLVKFTASLYELCPRCPPFRFSLPSPYPKEADTFSIPRVFALARTQQFPNT